MEAQGARAALTSMFSNSHAATLHWRTGFRADPPRTIERFILHPWTVLQAFPSWG